MQALLVYFVVAVAALYVGWTFMPAASRRRIVARIAALVHKWEFAGNRVVWLEAQLNKGTGCGSCKSCNACNVDRGKVRP